MSNYATQNTKNISCDAEDCTFVATTPLDVRTQMVVYENWHLCLCHARAHIMWVEQQNFFNTALDECLDAHMQKVTPRITAKFTKEFYEEHPLLPPIKMKSKARFA